MSPVHVGTMFSVDAVTTTSERFGGVPTRLAIGSLLGPDRVAAETCSPSEGELVPCQFHGFVHAVHLAYCYHAPLAISPDHVWLTIAQGLAQHIHLEPERWREKLGLHSGVRTLEIRRDGLRRHAPAEDWAEVWDGFVELSALDR